MEEWVAADPSRTIRRFASHEEQREAELRYWSERSLIEKLETVAELAEYYASIHKIDLNAQGPKRVVSRVERTRG